MYKNQKTHEETFPSKDFKFPCFVIESTLIPKTNELEMHWHHDLEIIQVLSGKVVYLINGFPYDVEAGDLVIINPKQVHTAKVISEGSQYNQVLILSYNLLSNPLIESIQEKYFEPLMHGKLVFSNHIPKKSHLALHTLINDMIQTVEQKSPYYELTVISKFYEVITYLFSDQLYYTNLAYKHKNELDSGYITRLIIEFVHENHMNALTLDSISKHTNVSKFYLCRLFKKTTGTTITNYLIHYRFSVAKRLLLDTKKNISTVGYEVGFNSASYFVSKFKSIYGITPKEFRTQNTH